MYESVNAWNGSNINIFNRLDLGVSNGQYIDMQHNPSFPGSLSQVVTLPSNGKYLLSFVAQYSGNASNHILRVFFNSNCVLNLTGQYYSQLIYEYLVEGSIGLN